MEFSFNLFVKFVGMLQQEIMINCCLEKNIAAHQINKKSNYKMSDIQGAAK